MNIGMLLIGVYRKVIGGVKVTLCRNEESRPETRNVEQTDQKIKADHKLEKGGNETAPYLLSPFLCQSGAEKSNNRKTTTTRL
jgi:hypothetical protein